jgi:hypothetical protein
MSKVLFPNGKPYTIIKAASFKANVELYVVERSQTRSRSMATVSKRENILRSEWKIWKSGRAKQFIEMTVNSSKEELDNRKKNVTFKHALHLNNIGLGLE